MYSPIIDWDKFAVNRIPAHRRNPKYKLWIKILLSPINRLHSIYKNYIDGTDSDYYDPLVNYNLDDDVIYNYKVYKSLIDNNVGNTPDINYDKWQQISNSFIGLDERSKFNSQKIVLEYALNKYFKKQIEDNGLVGFKQPDDPINPTNSDIYITNIAPAYTSFVSYTIEEGTSLSFTDKSTGYSFTDETFIGETSYRFSINIPSAVYSDIGSPEIADKIIKTFMNNYVPSGIYYEINTY